MARRSRSRLALVFLSLALPLLVTWLLWPARSSSPSLEADLLVGSTPDGSHGLAPAASGYSESPSAIASPAVMPGDRFDPAVDWHQSGASTPVFDGRLPTVAGPQTQAAAGPVVATKGTQDGSAATASVRIERREGDRYPLRRIATIGRDGSTVEMVADHLLVRPRPDAEPVAIERALAGLDARIRRQLAGGELLLVAFAGEDPSVLPAMRRRLAAQDWVARVEPDYIVQHCGERDEPRYDELWGLENTGQTGGTADADIDAPLAWRTTRGSDQVVVAVVDSGIDYNHPDLAANIWVNPGEIAGNGLDDDGNGYVDDIHGYDFFNDDGDPMDDNRHGTHCAGTIGAVGDNDIGIVGVCPRVRLLGMKFLGGNGSGATSDAIACMHYLATLVRDHAVPIKVVNNSWGGAGRSDELALAIEELGDLGVLSLAAAGNSGRDNDATPHYPSSYANASLLAVAATNHDDEKAYFSNYGANSVDLAAPGEGILSTVPGEAYESFNGTSMATPHVAGAAALLFAADPATATWQSVRDALLAGVDVLPALDGSCVTGGRLNLARALRQTGAVPVHLIIDDAAGDGDGLADVGETVDLRATVANWTAERLTEVGLHLSIVAPASGVSVLVAEVGCPDLDPAAQATSDALRISLAEDLVVPQVVQARLRVDSAQGSWTRVVGLPVGPSGGVSGTVTLDGAPLVGSAIEYSGSIAGLASDDRQFDGAVQSAADGSYLIPLPAGSWELQATYPDALASEVIELDVAAEDALQQDFAFTTVTIDGQVTDLLSGDPVADAQIAYAEPISASAVTGSDGRYAMTEILGRGIDLTVTCRHADYFTAQATRTLPPSTTIDFQMGIADIAVDPSSVAVELAPGASSTVELAIDNVGGSNLFWQLRDQVGRSRAGADATAGAELASLPAPNSIRFFFGGQGAGGMALVGDELWICGWYGSSVLRVLDRSDGSELREIELPAGLLAHDLAFDGSLVWATSSWFDDWIFAIDPADGSVVKQFVAPAIPGSEPKGIAYGDGGLWVSYAVTDPTVDNDPGGNRLGDRAIRKLDRADGSEIATLVADATIGELDSRRMSYFAGCLWFTDYANNAILGLDATDATIRHRFDDPWIDTDYFTVGLVSDDRGSLWLGPNIRNSEDVARLRQVDTGLRPWLSATPTAGDTASLTSTTVQLSLTADQAFGGDNQGTVAIGSNDPDQPHILVPVTLTVTDGNRAPTFTAAPSIDADPVALPATGQLSAAASDPDGDAIAWHWFQRAGPGVADFTDTDQRQPTVAFQEPGSYVLAARVSDEHGASTIGELTVTVTADGVRRRLVIDPGTLELQAAPGTQVDGSLRLQNVGWGPEGIDWQSRDPIRGALLDTSPASIVVDSAGMATSGTHHYYFHGGTAIEKHHRDGGVVDIIKMWLGDTRIKGYGLDYEDGHIWVAAVVPRFALFQVEEASEQAVHAVDIPEGRIPTGISLDPGGEDVWCLAYARDGESIDYSDGMIYRLARADGAVRRAMPLPAGIPRDQGKVHNIAFVEGLVWVLRSYPNPEISPGAYKPLLYGVDPASGALVDTFKPHTDKVSAICRGDRQTMWQVEYEVATFERFAYQVNVSDIPWLRSDPDSGAIPPRQQRDLTISCDASVAGVGRHEAELAVFSDDPAAPVQYVPVVFTVSDNQAPQITDLSADPAAPLTSTGLTVQANDPDGDPLGYAWQIVQQPTGSAPALQPDATTAELVFDKSGDYRVRVTVGDGRGGSASETIDLVVVQQATDMAIE